MRKLTKKDREFIYLSLLPTAALSCLLKNYVTLNVSDVIAFISIVMGFLLSALAILYSSPLRQVLYDKDCKGYDSRWEKIVVQYALLFKYCTVFVLLLMFEDHLPKQLTLFFLIHIVLFILILADQLFGLLLREIND